MQATESRRLPRRLRDGALLASGLIAVAAVAAACGSGSGSPGVASIATTTSAGTTALEPDGSENSNAKQTFSQCMRAHGIAKFPDANSKGGLTFNAGPGGLDPESAQFQAAQKACRKLMPDGGKEPSAAEQAKAKAQMLKFSACMRAHGLPKFPDPKFGAGEMGISIDRKSGLDPNSPVFQAAQKACEKEMPEPPDGATRIQAGGPGSGNGPSTSTAGK